MTKLLVDLGNACSEYQDRVLRGLSCQRIECGEIWSFVGAKQKHVQPGHPSDWGDVWTWTAIDSDSKLVPAWYIGARTATDALEFMTDLAGTRSISTTRSAAVTTGFALEEQRREYPSPPRRFAWSPNVDTMWRRYLGCIEGREPVASMAYVCLTVLEASVGAARGSREKAAEKYGIDPAVLQHLGHLASAVGDVSAGGRKAHVREPRPHTREEEEWMLAAVRLLIRRAGETAFDPERAYPVVTMADLPPLPDA